MDTLAERLAMVRAVGTEAGRIDAMVDSLKQIAEEVGGDDGDRIAVEAMAIRMCVDAIVEAVSPRPVSLDVARVA